MGITRLLGGDDVPVVTGAADTAAALAALERSDSGLLGDGGVVVNAGTGIQILRTGARPEARVDPKTHLYGDASGGWYEMLAIQNGGLALDWAQSTLGASWQEAVALAGGTAPGSSGATFLPFLTGERGGVAPFRPSAGWRHLTTTTGRAELLRAAFEAYAFTIRRGLEIIDAPAGPVLLTGGGGRDPWLRQLLADVLDRPVRFVTLRSVSGRGCCRACRPRRGCRPGRAGHGGRGRARQRPDCRCAGDGVRPMGGDAGGPIRQGLTGNCERTAGRELRPAVRFVNGRWVSERPGPASTR